VLGGVTFGASVQVPSLHVLGSYSATLHQTLATTTDSEATLARGTGSFRAKPPVRIAAGAGKMFDRFTL